jgi:CheY-like chemotaxis protein
VVSLAIMGASKSNNGERTRPRIFVVDDEPILLELAEKVLSGLECEIQTFTNPEIALQQYSSGENPPDVLITDFAMHEMNGLALIRACRRLNPQQKIILVSGTVDESVFNGTGVKPDRFLAKPYEPAVLTGMVRELLEH